MSRRSQLIRDRRIRILLWGSLCVILALVYFCGHPFVWKTESRRASGVQISLETASDYLIVVDYSTFKSPASGFMDMSFSLAWLNTFQQEIGPIALIGSNEFQDIDLKRYRTLILTSSASGQESWVPRIRSFLERGGTVVMEMPSGGLRSIASADGKGGLRTAQTLTFASGLSSEYMNALSELHLSNLTQLIGSAGPLEDAQTWMTIDGVPVIYSKNYGLGHVITVDFNYGMLITALQQGRPLDNFEIRNLRDTTHIETSDLALDENQTLPIADILERFLVYGVINDATPVVGLWPFFDGMDGALIISHRENGIGDASLWMTKYEASFKATSTLFVTSPLTLSDPGLDVVDDTHSEIGLMFDAYGDEISRAKEPMGPFKISPVWRQLNVEEQLAAVKARLDEHTPVIASQTRQGLWGEHYTQTFRMLSAAGFKVDASYRTGFEKYGYAFSTGMPFMPIDTTGLLFNILEFPVSFPEMTTQENASVLETFLEASEREHHEVLSVSFEPGEYAKNPVAETFQTWQAVYKMATLHKHWVTNYLSYFRFSRARFTAELRTRLSEMQLNHKKVQVLRVELLAPEAEMHISVPKQIGDRVFVEARRGLQRVREDTVLSDAATARFVSVSGYERVLVQLSKGFNAIDVVYE